MENAIKIDVKNLTFYISPKLRGIRINIELNNILNRNYIDIDNINKLLSGSADNLIIKLIMKVCQISKKEANPILNEFLGYIGTLDDNVIENIKNKKDLEIDLTQFCDDNIKVEMIEKGINLCFDGNSKEYIINIIQDKYNLKISDARFIADTAYHLKNLQLSIFNSDEYFLNEDHTQLNIPFVASQILKFHKFKTVGYENKKDIYIYENGYYINRGVSIIEQLTDQLLSLYTKDSHRSEVIKYIKNLTLCHRKELDPNMYLLNLENGIYNVKTGEFIEHTPDIVSIIRIPVKYNPSATCPQIEKFLNDVVSERDKTTLLEFIGYCLIPDSSLQKAMMLYGSGSNGKSVFIDLVNEFFGFENISILSLQKMSINNFATARLFGKLLNTFSDLPSKKLTTDSTFKTLTGDRRIHGEAKFKESFEFENTIRLLFSANVLPEPAGDIDDNYSYYRRWLLIPFLNTFEGKDVDKDLLNKLLTEKSGFLNLLLNHLKNVIDNKGFTYNPTPEEVEEIYIANMLSMDTFFEEKIVYKNNAQIKKEYVWKQYDKWCKKNKVPTKKYQTFCKEMIKRGIKDKREGRDEKTSYFLDILVKGNSIIENKEPEPKRLNLHFNEPEIIDPALGLKNYIDGEI